MIKDALTNYSQAAKEMVEKLNQYEHNKDCAICANERADELSEQNERMRKALEKFKLELTPHSFCSRIEYEQVHHALDEALTPPTGQKEKE